MSRTTYILVDTNNGESRITYNTPEDLLNEEKDYYYEMMEDEIEDLLNDGEFEAIENLSPDRFDTYTNSQYIVQLENGKAKTIPIPYEKWFKANMKSLKSYVEKHKNYYDEEEELLKNERRELYLKLKKEFGNEEE
jgi:ABC-type Fe3+-hydroxamate transport system substrate-binding protein